MKYDVEYVKRQYLEKGNLEVRDRLREGTI